MRKEKYQAVNTDSVTRIRCRYTLLYLQYEIMKSPHIPFVMDLKGLFTEFTWEGHGTVPSSEKNGVLLAYSYFIDPSGRCSPFYGTTAQSNHAVTVYPKSSDAEADTIFPQTNTTVAGWANTKSSFTPI